MANPNDEIRDKILRHLYDVHGRAKGPKGVGVGIRDLHRTMKEQGLKQADVNSNLDYLIQRGWVREAIEQRTFTTPRGTTQQAERRSYKISDVGIDKLEGASTYHREESFSRINVTNIRGVTVIGSGNVVNTESADLSRTLSDLEQAVNESKSLSDEDKLNLVADLGTIQTQLSKPKPNGGVIKTVWAAIEKVVIGVEFVELAARAAVLIAQLPV